MDSDLEREIDRLLAPDQGRRTSPRARPTPGGRIAEFMHGRRLLFALLLAMAELVVVFATDPGVILGLTAVALVLGLAGWLWLRLRPGVWRDVVGVVALAQALMISVPLIFGGLITVAFVLGFAVLAALAVVAFKSGRRPG